MGCRARRGVEPLGKGTQRGGLPTVGASRGDFRLRFLLLPFVQSPSLFIFCCGCFEDGRFRGQLTILHGQPLAKKLSNAKLQPVCVN